MYYAQNLYQPNLEEALAAWADGIDRLPDSSRWFLLDGSMIEATERQTLTRQAWLSHKVFDGTRFKAYGDNGPWLLQAPIASKERPAWFGTLVRICNGLPALSMIETQRASSLLKATLASLADVRTEDGQSFYCRFADTRVLASLVRVLNEKQRKDIAATIYRWHYVDRHGAVVKAVNVEPSDEVSSNTSLTLDARQFAQMLETSEPDNLFYLLHEVAPQLIPEKQRGVFHVRLDRILAEARKKKVVAAPDQLQFAILALTCGENFHTNPALQSTWDQVGAGTTTLSNLMASWEEGVWDALHASQ